MIKAFFYKDPSGFLTGYEISGHADFSEEGSDIICSAVSALSINTANTMEEIVGIQLITESRDGYLKVMLPSSLSDLERHDASLLLHSLRSGLASIQESYGSQYLQLTTF